MIRFLKIIGLVFLLLGCNNNKINKPPKPDNLIPKDKMVEVLYDMVLISSAKGSERHTLEKKGIYPQDYILTKYEIDSLQFAESNNYYAYDIDLYDDLFSKVKSKLQRDKKRISEELEVEKAKKDSIRKSNKKRLDSLKNLGKDKNGTQIKNILKKDSLSLPNKIDKPQISTRQ
ncbi:MAG: DUF4296 domain-containing protein [Flavobacteriaceae bacterium]|nr:DUF4296 domain-containing protein [Flavobacteriaceae bacterium]